MLQYYRDLWQIRSYIFALLTEVTGSNKTINFEWNKSCTKAFESTKKATDKRYDTIFPPKLHTGVRDLQLGAVIS